MAKLVGQTGTYSDMRKLISSKGLGQFLQADHIPSNASNLRRARQGQSRALSPEQTKNIRNNGSTMVVPTEAHRGVSPTFGGRNQAGRQIADANNPGAAIDRDVGAYENNGDINGQQAEINKKNLKRKNRC